MTYVIISVTEKDDGGNDLFWHNQHGWVPFSQADRFSEDERRTVTLPQSGSWRNEAQEAGMQQYLSNVKRKLGEMGGV